MVTEKSSRSFLTIFFSIRLRVRGIRCNYPLTYWKGYEPRVDFPDKLLSNDKFIEVIPKDMKWNYIFVEPGVEQEIKYLTLIPCERAQTLLPRHQSTKNKNLKNRRKLFRALQRPIGYWLFAKRCEAEQIRRTRVLRGVQPDAPIHLRPVGGYGVGRLPRSFA